MTNSSFQNVPRSRAESRISTDTWVEKIPQHWHAIQLKYLIAAPITDGPHTTPEFTQAGVPFLSVDGIQNGELYFEKTRFISQEDHESFKVKAFPIKDDILMGKAASTGKIARVKVNFEFSIWSPLALIRPNKSLINSGYLEYSLKSIYLQAQIENLCTSSTQKNISMDDIPTLLFLLPPLEVQQRIADFLDTETAQIDALILEKERMLELLEEKRAALISHAVTKGLNPNAPMKDSGLEWLGKIPAHWDLRKIKYFAVVGNGSTPNRENLAYWQGGTYPWLNSSVVNDRTIREAPRYVTEEALEECHLPKIIPPALLVGITGQGKTRGKTAVLEYEATINQHIAFIKPDDGRAETYFLSYAMDTAYGFLRNESDGAGSTKGAITCEQLGNFFLALPSLEEQQEILEFINAQIGQFSGIESDLKHSLQLLHERRSALITAAVTGQLEVQGVTA